MTTGLSYKKAADYWAHVPATIDGVLGGYGNISDIDINGSNSFLEKVFGLHNPPGSNLALDCGAGIGRVTKLLLMPRFDRVDLLEQDENFINTAIQWIGQDNAKLGTLYHNGLQNFRFETHKKYDIIWIQWVLCFVNDFDLIAFLNKCRFALKDNGVVIVKENISTSNAVDFDEEDSSITRPLCHLIELFKEAQYKIILRHIQEGFPEDLYPVHSFLLIPESVSIEIDNVKSIRKPYRVDSEISL